MSINIDKITKNAGVIGAVAIDSVGYRSISTPNRLHDTKLEAALDKVIELSNTIETDVRVTADLPSVGCNVTIGAYNFDDEIVAVAYLTGHPIAKSIRRAILAAAGVKRTWAPRDRSPKVPAPELPAV